MPELQGGDGARRRGTGVAPTNGSALPETETGERVEAKQGSGLLAPPGPEPELASLIERVVAREDDAFEQLHDWYRPLIGEVVRTLMKGEGNEYDVEDAVQQVFAALFRSLHTYDAGEADFGAWLFAVTKHAVNDWFRTRPEAVPMAPRELKKHIRDAWDGDLHRWLDRDSFMQLIACLPPVQKASVVLRFVGDLSHEQAGAVLGKDANAVVQAQHHGIATLRGRMAPRSGNGGVGRVERQGMVRYFSPSPIISQRRLSLAF